MAKLSPITRRAALGGLGLALAPLAALAEPRGAGRDLHFEVWRNRQKIGAHSLVFHGDESLLTVAIMAEMLVKLGPIPLFRYRHEATETWRGGRFASLESHSVSNGRTEQVSAVRADDGVAITTGGGRTVHAPARTCPLTHWNAAALGGPLFNPQTGAVLRETVSQGAELLRVADGRTVNATRYQLRGDAEITDWYGAEGEWMALRGRVDDGSYVEYRRVA